MGPRDATLARKIAVDIANGGIGGIAAARRAAAGRAAWCQPATVRAALQQLQDLGPISRRKRTGTRVEASWPRTEYAPSLTTLEDLVHDAAETERHVQEVEEIGADDQLAERLGCRPGQRWLRLPSPRVAIHGGRHGRSPPRPSTSIRPTVPACAAMWAGERSSSRRSSSRRYGTYAAEVRQEIRAVSVDLPDALRPRPRARSAGAGGDAALSRPDGSAVRDHDQRPARRSLQLRTQPAPSAQTAPPTAAG